MGALEILDRLGRAEATAHDDRDVAALAYRRGGRVTIWRSPNVTDAALIEAWADRALASGRDYADLLYCELVHLGASAT